MSRYTHILAFMFCTLLSFQSWSQQREFVHPGILVNLKQLDYVRNNLDKEPWKSAYTQTLNSVYAKIDYQPRPWEAVECGSYSNPDRGCGHEVGDAQAAYTQAILWRLTRNSQYAENVRTILNAWANTLVGGHPTTCDNEAYKCSNGPLQAAWAAELFTRAAEIVKYSYADWPQSEKNKATKMFAEQYLPDVQKMFTENRYKCYTHNWQLSGVEAMLNIAVFNKDTALFNDAIDKWRVLVPAYIYLTSDGNRPRDTAWCRLNDTQIIQQWAGQSVFVNGLATETCRDLEHNNYGLAAIINVAETAKLQGIDLYGEQRERITKAMEFQTQYQNGTPVPPWLCDGKLTYLGTNGTFEIGYNEYAVRDSMTLPQTQQFLDKTRPTTGRFHYLWETLTHGLTGVVR